MQTNLEKIPVALKRIKGWVGFDIQPDGKTPISLVDYKKVGPTDKDRLVDFESAAKALENRVVDGLQYLLDLNIVEL